MSIHSRLEKLEQQAVPTVSYCVVGSRPNETPEQSFSRVMAEKPGFTHYVYTGVPEHEHQ